MRRWREKREAYRTARDEGQTFGAGDLIFRYGSLSGYIVTVYPRHCWRRATKGLKMGLRLHEREAILSTLRDID